jgi:hypothetical protein
MPNHGDDRQKSKFDPTWRDEVLDPVAIEIPLVFPDDTPPNGKIWIKSKPIFREMVFKEEYKHEKPRWETSILKRSDMINYYTATDSNGNVIPQDDPAYDVFFPPKAWMSDTIQERCMMHAAAKLARGKVLVGGLGLAIYPQLVFHMQRPIESITILEQNANVIELVQEPWQKTLNNLQKQQVLIVEGTIEDYLQQTEESFDTFYFDTWEDCDPRFLPHVNYLIQLALSKCTPTGQIQCWGYAQMVDTFVEHALAHVKHNFPWEDFHLDPGMEKFSQWLQAQSDTPSEETIKTVAREIALTTVKSRLEYDRDRCFTPFAVSFSDAHVKMAMSRKVKEQP